VHVHVCLGTASRSYDASRRSRGGEGMLGDIDGVLPSPGCPGCPHSPAVSSSFTLSLPQGQGLPPFARIVGA